MVPNVITDSSIMFVARGRPWTLAADHPKFVAIRDELLSDAPDPDRLVRMADVTTAVADITHGRAILTEEGVTLDGAALPAVWMKRAIENPDELQVLVVKEGDIVRIEGDSDAPDGLYTVGATDDADADARVFVEAYEDEDGFFGFVDNKVIKEIAQRA